MTRLPAHNRKLMLSFEGMTVPDPVKDTLENNDVSGMTLFRPHNYETPVQLRALVDEMQRLSSGDLPLLIAIDQEGGQLHAFGAPATMWAGNMALGAVDDPDLTRKVGAAIARELRAVGINVDYAPVADLATNPMNPATGARSFGDDPELVARHVKAIIEGLQSEGVAATMKHFPGKGDSKIDSHHGLPIIDHDTDHLESTEFVPFKAAIEADVKLAMTGHFALPALTGSDDLPCTLAEESNTGLLRDEMGFRGAMITDALDMGSLKQGAYQIIDMIAAINSGVDLLLLTADAEQEERATTGLELALSRRLIDTDLLAESDRRVLELREWVGGFSAPDLDVVGCDEHAALNGELARRSITLLRNDGGLLPLATDGTTSTVVIEMRPAVLTPADTSHYEEPTLAASLASVLEGTIDGVVIPMDPTGDDVAGAISAAANADLVVVGTSAAQLFERQGALVRRLLDENDQVVVVAQRTPWDLLAFPDAPTYVCAWSVNPASMQAVANALAGKAPITGRTPVRTGDFPTGSGIDLG